MKKYCFLHPVSHNRILCQLNLAILAGCSEKETGYHALEDDMRNDLYFATLKGRNSQQTADAFPVVAYKKKKSDDRKCVCCSQARVG